MRSIDENRFFREATLRICSSLDIEKSLSSCFQFIREYTPAGYLSLIKYHYETGTVETVADTHIESFPDVPEKIILPPEAQQKVQDEWIDLRVRRIDNISDHVVLSVLGKVFTDDDRSTIIIDDLSALVIDLMLEGKEVGVITVVNDGLRKFTSEDVRLLTLLNEPFSIALTNGLRYRELLNLKNLLSDDNQFLKEELWQLACSNVVGADSGLKGVMDLAKQVAPLNSPVLLLGETGTGKEVVAGAIHSLSSRKNGPFIKVNCGAIPETMMDSELFGHEKGAFTGAVNQKRGRFERSHKGTIFLDEIGELHPEVQVRLLRVLQEKEIERVGGTETIKVDIRVIAATHCDLESLMAEGKFREDLYFRLKIFPIVIPPLRNRTEDIPSLVHHFLQKKSKEMQLSDIPSLSATASRLLTAYSWPGNVRELENAIERELILNRGAPLEFNNIEPTKKAIDVPPDRQLNSDTFNLNQIMKKHIENALEAAGGKVEGKGGAAELLSINPRTLRHRMRKIGVSFGRKSAQQ
ncbi:MAG: sigma 54-interacting transcriptional regulator [Deltaproteobacteria bacterium]|nr:sigma 54-interacting transcriptional regulator [Deltaproteobacteria bacterium]MBT4644433.1 sigma 54-interacting transcriptional regulator [Deltaproteobacteria bacterium]